VSDNKDEDGGAMTTKLRRVTQNPTFRTMEITFEVTETFLQALADNDEQAGLYLLELLSELMVELKQYSRGEHPRLSRQNNPTIREKIMGDDSYNDAMDNYYVKMRESQLRQMKAVMDSFLNINNLKFPKAKP